MTQTKWPRYSYPPFSWIVRDPKGQLYQPQECQNTIHRQNMKSIASGALLFAHRAFSRLELAPALVKNLLTLEKPPNFWVGNAAVSVGKE